MSDILEKSQSFAQGRPDFKSLSWIHRGLANKFLDYMNGLIQKGQLDMSFPDGQKARFGQAGTRPQAHIHVRSWQGLKKIITGGSLGFSEAFMAGQIDVPKLYPLFELILKNTPKSVGRGGPLDNRFFQNVLASIRHRLNANTRKDSKRNIAAHYDLGNAFYQLWLDETMTYSSALYKQVDEDLRAAQYNKYASIIERGGFTPGSHILEIGCGWGGFAEHAAKHGDCKVTGITISQEQYDFAAARIQKEGLSEKVSLRLQDYRDVEANAFDGVASIEMFEAVGEAYWPTYFDKVHEVMKPGGKASLQIITIDDAEFEGYRRRPDFIQTYIFPGGMLPSTEALQRVTAAAKLDWLGELAFAPDYARTLITWRDRFEAVWDKVSTMGFDERFRRMWLYYLDYCAAGFDHGHIDVKQVILQKPA